MKKSRKLTTLGICSFLFLGLAACQQQYATSEGTNQRQSSSAKVPWKASYTNLNNQVSTEEVKSLLSAHLEMIIILLSAQLAYQEISLPLLTQNTMLRN